MKFYIAAIIFSLLLFNWHCNAIFDNIFNIGLPDDDGGGSILNPDGFDVTNILECAADAGGRFNVELVPTGTGDQVDFDYYVPARSRYPFPSSLQWASTNFDLIVALLPELQGFSRSFQALNPADVENAYSNVSAENLPWSPSRPAIVSPPQNFQQFNITADFVYSTGVREQLPVCDEVLSFLAANRLDIIDNATYITEETIVAFTNASNVTGISFAADMVANRQDTIDSVNRVFNGLRCRVVHAWRDLGPTYLPRYAIAGRCFERGCSVPIRNGQFCRPDLREINYRRLEALRWDCCWELADDPPTADSTYRFNCGWRRVNIPVLCDCDCLCPSPRKPL